MQPTVHPLPAPTERGFTLVELMVVVAIVAILTSLAMPSMREFVGKWQVSNAVNSFNGSLQLARSEAVKRGRVARMCLSSNGSTCSAAAPANGWASGWLIYVDNDSSATLTAADQVVLTQGAISNFNSITSSATSTFVFTPTGFMQAGATAQAISFQWDSGATIQKALCVNLTGRSRVVKDSTLCATP